MRHRDLKPPNFLLKKKGVINTMKISDFGTAMERTDRN